MENSTESRQRGSKKGGPLFESGAGIDAGFFAVSDKAFVRRDWTKCHVSSSNCGCGHGVYSR